MKTKQVKREEAAKRQAAYNKLSLDDKIKRAKSINPNSKQVRRLEALKAKAVEAAAKKENK